MPAGFFGTRADLLLDTVFVLNLLAPVVAWVGARMARRGEHRRHMGVQLALFGLMYCALFALEGSIRLHGGSGSLVAGSPYVGTALLKWVFVAHIGGAVITYVLWMWLVIRSFRRRWKVLPGSFSAHHRRWGFVVFAGLVYTAASAIFVYIYGFVAT